MCEQEKRLGVTGTVRVLLQLNVQKAMDEMKTEGTLLLLVVEQAVSMFT